jgi:nicotinate-nucleotide adenylyltransferase
MMGILGGSFDPIHCGHLHIAMTLYQQFHLSEIRFIPCKNPVSGKKIIANEQQRLTMLKLALQPYSYFLIDKRELQRNTPSYMIETLASLRQEWGDMPLGLILGYDNLIQLDHWHQWTSLIDYAHLLIVPRHDQTGSYSQQVCTFVEKYQTRDASLLTRQPAGLLFMTHVQSLPISATYIRKTIASSHYPIDLLPSSVLNYILEQKLYL